MLPALASSSTLETYWASRTGLELATAAMERVKGFYSALPRLIMYQRWAKARRTYYGLSGQEDPFDISRPGVAGDEGQLTSIRVNYAGAIMRRQIGSISQSIPEFDPVPENSDYTSLAQVSFTKKLLDYYMDTRDVGAKLFDAAQFAGTDGEGVLEVAWDAKGGPKLDAPDPLLPARTNAGDLTFRVYSPLDLPCDLSRLDMEHDWRFTRRPVNKFDLAARYPSLAADIIGVRSVNYPQSTAPTDRLQQEREIAKDKGDSVFLYTLYHRQTDALPDGKIAEFLSEDVLLYEGALPYEEVPLVQLSPGKILRSPYGESPFHHLLALQDIYDLLASSVASNQAALALHLLWMPDGLDMSHMEFSEGFAVLRGEAGPMGNLKPEVLNFNSPNDVALKFMDTILQAMRTIGGTSSTGMGEPPPNVRSGEFAALIAQQALEYAGAFQYSFQQAVAKTGNLIVSILQQYADQPIVAEIAGEAHGYQLAEFTKAKLDKIHRVNVKSGNPAARTPQFNIAAASDLLAKGVIDNPRDYLMLMRTGEMDTMVDDDEAEQMLIRRENEILASFGTAAPGGPPPEPPPVIATDTHVDHIKHHGKVLSNPASRGNQAVVTATLAHIQLHLNELAQVDPALLAILGQPSLQASPMPGDPAGQNHHGHGQDQGTDGPQGPSGPNPPKVQGQPQPSSKTPPLPKNAPPNTPQPPNGAVRA